MLEGKPMLIGRIEKQEGPFWSADIDVIGAYTQGRSRREARAMMVELVEMMVDKPQFRITLADYPAGGEGTVYVTANRPALLAAQILKYQRAINGLSLAQVAKRLGARSRNAYARYEQGASVPTLDKFYELLEVVAPGVVFAALASTRS